MLGVGTVDGVTYTLPLALFDIVPVVLAAFAYMAVARLAGTLDEGASRRRLALVGAALVVIGGAGKAVWKLFAASNGTDLTWLDIGLFWWQAPGFVVLAGAMVTSRVRRVGLVAADVVVVAVVLAVVAGESAASILLLATMTLGTLVLFTALARLALRHKQGVAAAAIVLALVAIFVLAGLASIEEQTATLQWIEEATNTLAQGLLLLGVTMVLARARTPLVLDDTEHFVG